MDIPFVAVVGWQELIALVVIVGFLMFISFAAGRVSRGRR